MWALHVLFALLVNAIPAYGVFALGWSVGTLLILFWWENLIGVLLAALRVRLHQRRSGDPAYSDPKLRPTMEVNGKQVVFQSHAVGYLSLALPFALTHGIFAIVLPFAFAQEAVQAALWLPTWDALRLGGALIVATLVLDLLLDLPTLARQSYKTAKRVANARFARVLVLHVVIIFGAIAASKFESPYGMLAVMIGFKTLVDMSTALPRKS